MRAPHSPDRPQPAESVTLRQWRESDVELYVAMNRDPEVMRYFPALLEREQSVASYERHRRLIEERGWGLWAVDVDGEFAGFTGLAVPTFTAPFTPCVEIGWRLRRPFWGRSIGYRAALQALDYGFRVAKLPALVSFTAVINTPSRRLMERLGFTHDPAEDFDHPTIAEGSPLRRHVLYRAMPAHPVE